MYIVLNTNIFYKSNGAFITILYINLIQKKLSNPISALSLTSFITKK